MNPPDDDRVVRFARRAAVALFLVAFVNFVWFAVGVTIAGGHALDGGTVVDGRYYFDNNGTPVQVTRFAWNYTYFHAISVFVTQPLGIFGTAAFLMFANRREQRLARTPEASCASVPPPTGQPA